MADSKNSKISELVELTDPSNADYIPIVDTANQETKKISYSSLINALNEDDDSYSKIEADALFDANTALITSNDGDIAALDGRVTTAEGNITSNDGDITTLQGRVTTAEGNITSNDGDITTLQGRVTTAEGNITSNDGDITTLQGRVTTAEGNITSNDGDITTLQGRVTTAEGNITSNDVDIALKAPIANPTFTGTVTAPLINAGSIDFNAGGGNGGELSWNNTEKTLNLVTGTGVGNNEVTLQLGQEVVLYAINKSGADMTNGQVVSVSGVSANKPSIVLAQADTVANARGVIGVITQDIADNANGFVTLLGKVRGLTLSTTVGDLLYLSDTQAGGLTNVRPDIAVEIGRVLANNGANGVLEVNINSEVAVHELEQDVIANTAAISAETARSLAAEALLAPIANPTFTEATVEGILRVEESALGGGGSLYVDDYIKVMDIDGIIEAFTLKLPSRNTLLGKVADVTYIGYIDKNRYPMSIVVQDGSTTLSNVETVSGFSGNQNLTDFYFGGNVRTVSVGAFNSCLNLINLNLNNDLYSIGESAFLNCIGITIPDQFPDGLTVLGSQAFRGAFNVSGNETLVLPDKLYTIGNSAFREAYFYGLKLGRNNTTLGDNAFRDAPLMNSFDKGINSILKVIGVGCFQSVFVASFDFSGTALDTIAANAFRDNTSLTTVTFPDNSEFTIGAYAFAGCSSLNNFSFPSSLTTVSSNVLRDCPSLDSITIPAGVTLIEAGAFRNCTSLTTLNCLATTAPSAFDTSFLNMGTTEINVPVGATGYGTTFHLLTVNYIL